MKKLIYLTFILFLITSCLVKKETTTRVVNDYDVFKKHYESCMDLLKSSGIKDSAQIVYYKRSCEKEANNKAVKVQMIILYKRNGKVIREEILN